MLGFVPVIGFVADIANAVWYYKEGKTFEMWSSIVSAIPGVGGLIGAGVKGVGTAFKAAKVIKAGELIKTGTLVAGNVGSLALSGAIIWDNATNIGNYLAGNEYKYDVWDSVRAIGFALIGTVLGAKGLEDSGKAFNALKNKPVGIGSPKQGKVDTQELALKAEKARDELVINTPGGNKKSMAIGAYDIETGDVVADFAGPIPENISPILVNRADKIGGVGSTGLTDRNILGVCAEFRTANQLLLKGSDISNIRFTNPIRPRTGEIRPNCGNCIEMFFDILNK